MQGVTQETMESEQVPTEGTQAAAAGGRNSADALAKLTEHIEKNGAASPPATPASR